MHVHDHTVSYSFLRRQMRGCVGKVGLFHLTGFFEWNNFLSPSSSLRFTFWVLSNSKMGCSPCFLFSFWVALKTECFLKKIPFSSDSAVYTPKDGDNWMLAKLNVQTTDIGYSQLAEHLGRVRILNELRKATVWRLTGHRLFRSLRYGHTFDGNCCLSDSSSFTRVWQSGRNGSWQRC